MNAPKSETPAGAGAESSGSGEQLTGEAYTKLDVGPEAAAESLRRVWPRLQDSEERRLIVKVFMRMHGIRVTTVRAAA